MNADQTFAQLVQEFFSKKLNRPVYVTSQLSKTFVVYVPGCTVHTFIRYIDAFETIGKYPKFEFVQ